MRRRPSLIRRLAGDQGGVAAVEFAFILPIFVLLILGAVEYGHAISVQRKVTLTTRAVTDLTTQYVQMKPSDVATVLGASSQIMAPYDTANLSIVLSEITTNALGVSTVDWSQALHATPLTVGKIISMPVGSTRPGCSVILSQVGYVYTPIFGSTIVGTINMTDRISMSPRLAANIALVPAS